MPETTIGTPEVIDPVTSTRDELLTSLQRTFDTAEGDSNDAEIEALQDFRDLAAEALGLCLEEGADSPAHQEAVPSAKDVLITLLSRHSSDNRRDCGARTVTNPCGWRRNHEHVYHCTQEPGHDTRHKDGLHCWAFETFDDTEVVGYEPRDLSSCVRCGTAWPCAPAKELTALAQELGIELPTTHQ